MAHVDPSNVTNLLIKDHYFLECVKMEHPDTQTLTGDDMSEFLLSVFFSD